MNSNELKLIDIAARLPYGDVEVEYKGRNMLAIGIADGNVMLIDGGNVCWHNIASLKPYLRPLDSMTKEEYDEYYDMSYCIRIQDVGDTQMVYDAQILIDWLNAHHFDYRDLIDNGLALVAPDGMY